MIRLIVRFSLGSPAPSQRRRGNVQGRCHYVIVGLGATILFDAHHGEQDARPLQLTLGRYKKTVTNSICVIVFPYHAGAQYCASLIMFAKPRPKKSILPPPNKKRRTTSAVEEISFDHDAREEYLSGFHKRKQQRIKRAQEEAAKNARLEKIEARKQVLSVV